MSEKTLDRPFGGLSPREAAQRAAAKRREKAQERAERAEQDLLGVRQRLGQALSKNLTVSEWDRILQDLHKEKPSVEVRALAYLMDQSFGKSQDAEPENPSDPFLDELTREQRGVLRQLLAESMDDAED